MSESATLATLLAERRLIVCVGPGGVGKTTLAAALAIEAARRGRRVAVITIDPAKRLADALGLDGLDDALRPVAGLDGAAGSLDAAMLDTKSSYDALIARISHDPASRRAILDNRVYQSFSRTLARSHAYIAMERLSDVLGSGSHDLVVLDTPPTRSALDILDAPGRLSRFLDERVLRAFVGSKGVGTGAWLKARGTEAALRLFGAMVGDGLMRELAGFFEVFFHLRRGFSERAAAVSAALTSESTSFVLVTAPQATHLADAAYLWAGLLARGAPLDAVLFNRAFHVHPDGRRVVSRAAWALGEGAWDAEAAGAVVAAAQAHREALARENRDFGHAMAAFDADRAASVRLAFPVLGEEPASLDALLALLSGAALP